jgi:hypothetical protein
MKVPLRSIGELAISVVSGVLIPLGLFLLLLFISGLDWEVPLVDRNPFAWILFWPDLIWTRILREGAAETATYITTIVTFSVSSFAILRLCARHRQKRLPS